MEKSKMEDVYPMTDIQKGMVLLSIMNDKQTIYHDQFVFHIPKINPDVFSKAISLMVQKHSILRTAFDLDNYSDEVQIVYSEIVEDVTFEDITSKDAKDQEIFIKDFMKNELKRPFEFKKAPLWRINVFNINENNSIYIFQFHHAILDGWSLASFNAELFTLYFQLEVDINHKPQMLKTTFKDAVVEEIAEKTNINTINYWKEKLKEYKRLDIFSKSEEVIFDVIRREFDQKMVERIKVRSLKDGLTYINVLFGAYVYALSMLTIEEDFVVGLISNNRPVKEDGEKILGCFLNSIPVKMDFKDFKGATWLEYLKGIEAQITELKTKGRSTLYEISKITGERVGTENPFFDVIFNYIDFHVYGEMSVPESRINEFDQNGSLKLKSYEATNTFLDLNVIESTDKLLIFEYRLMKKIKSGITLDKIHQFVEQLVDCYLNSPSDKIDSNSILPLEEKEKLINDFNKTDKKIDFSLSVIDLFVEQLNKNAEKEALIINDKVYSYKELDVISNQFANYLNEGNKINKDDLVGIKLHRSEWLVITILAVWKSGGAYVPIDPTYPENRIAYMEENSNCKIIIDSKMLEQFIIEKEKYATKYDIQSIDENSLAYMIYTSGSTGEPKGVMIEHTALTNFILGMNDALEINESDHLLAVTSISFDISILELFWTLCNGIKTTIKQDNLDFYDFDNLLQNDKKMDFSLFYFASQDADGDDKYKLLMDSARFGDENDFSAIWIPERHFHEFGGIFPNPSLLGASIATITKNIKIHSGSVVLPLHDTIRVAEEWSVVDNLSKGRVALSIASGWHADDFVFKPENYTNRHSIMFDQIEELKDLWKGSSVKRINGVGNEVELNIYPKPIQKEIPIWITSSGSVETFKNAGKIGANLLTHLLGQDIKVLEKNIKAYKEELVNNGHDVEKAKITVMLHAYVGNDMDSIKEIVKEPFKNYLRSSVGLLKNLLNGLVVEETTIEEKELEDLLEMVFERYWNTSALFGTKENCRKILNSLHNIGVTEIGCLIDFGIENEKVMEGLTHLTELKNEFNSKGNTSKDQGITSMQITPSYLSALIEDKESHKFLKSIKNLIVGGEFFSEKLKKKALELTDATIYNMYGPTETTIWSTFCKVESEKENSIGKPIANTRIYILNKERKLCPINVKGELYIGGKGLSRGYYNQETTTTEKFIDSPFDKGEKIYNTGDLARWLPDGTIEFFGREDGQVKIRGHRIELGEIEYQLAKKSDIDEVAVIDRELNDGNKELIAYVTSKSEQNSSELRNFLMKSLPAIMVPAYFVQIDKMPLTSNGKINKKSLLNIDQSELTSKIDYLAPRDNTEKELVEIWEEILNRTPIGVKDNFFEIGGSSLNVVRLRRLLKKKMNVSISIIDLFKYNTIEDLSYAINQELNESEEVEENVDVLKF
ncbi:MupA/Atu3671 family FMN-dependent luciferase-like monooxygenase [Flavobacterium sp. FlaQc-50]|uniref:MupA/Atu3671 family FMN-dependent luciferase-like monooxygenase n=1 Tax=unclassified Flavobacterium TaxID=196869 RepID=UPI003756B98D